MSRFGRSTSYVVVLVILAARFAVPNVAWCQEAEQPADAPADAAPEADPLREQSIYIPYEKLQRVFEEHGRGVFLPYEQFQELWRAARQKDDPVVTPKPPVAAIIAGIDNVATVEKDVVRVRARLTIDVLAEGWSEVPLRLADAAITSATIGDAPARILGGPAEGYRLLVEHKGTEPAQVELQLEYARAIGKSPGRNSVSFQAPQAPVSRWEVRIPEPGVKVDIHPLIAATEAPDEPAADEPEAAQTVVLAFVGAAPVVRIDWTPRAEGAKGLEALASVEAQQQVWITEGTTRNRVLMNYSIRRAELSRLEIEVPADQKVVNVFDANVRQWSIERAEDGGAQRVLIDLFEPAKESQQVTVELEQFTEEKEQTEVAVPAVRALNVGRQQGVVVVSVAEGFRAEAATASGLLQVDPADLPESIRGGNWTFAYRYAAVPFELTLTVEKLQPRISADTLVEATLQPERLVIDATIAYTIERAGVFRLDVDVPAGFRVTRVTGREFNQFVAAGVDSHLVEPGDSPKLVVNLAKKAQGPVGLAVRLQRDLSEPDLLSPTGKTADIPLPIPRPNPEGIERSAGRLIVYAPESLRVLPSQRAGLREIALGEAFQAIPSGREGSGAAGAAVLAFAFTDEPASLNLAAERRRPQVTVRQLLLARVEEGVIKYRATFLYDVRYSSVKSLRLDVPATVAADLRIETAGFREKTIEPPPDDLAEGYVAWQITGEAELLGEGKIELVWEDQLEKLEVGKPADIDIPRLVPREVHRAWGQIVLAKVETIDVAPKGEPVGLRGIDPQEDLILPVPGAARALEFHNDWQLTVAATRYQLEELKRTSIERSVVRAVVARSNEIGVQALYRMRSARQRLEVKLPESVGFDAQPLRINGRPVPLEQGAEGTYFLPLVDVEADTEFVLELRYAMPDPVAGSGARIVLPAFPHEPASQKTHLCVYLPREWAMLGATGPWTPEPGANGSLGAATSPHRAAELIRWVVEGISIEGDPNESFPTDGTPYLFSTLRPAAPPEGDLRVYTADETWLHAGVFAVVLLCGVVLLPLRFPSRIVAVGLGVAVLVLLAVFTPVFAGHVVDEAFALAVFLVVVLWVAWFALRAWPKVALCVGAMIPVSSAGAKRRRPVSGQPAGDLTATLDALKQAEGGDDPREKGLDLVEPSPDIPTPSKEPDPLEKGLELDRHDVEPPPGEESSESEKPSGDADTKGGPAHE